MRSPVRLSSQALCSALVQLSSLTFCYSLVRLSSLAICSVALSFALCGCSRPQRNVVHDGEPLKDIGGPFECRRMVAPWDGLENETGFSCHSTEDRFFFSFDVIDSTLCVSSESSSEMVVNDEDRVEVFFCPDAGMRRAYFCAEIDPCGRVMDYRARYYRRFDFGWNFSSLQTSSQLTGYGYRVGGSISRAELKSMGLDLEKGFYIGVFQADRLPDGGFHWFSLVPSEDEVADFHKPDILLGCRMTPVRERRGVVIYPNDVTSVGVSEWTRRISLSGINLIGLHAATVNDPIDTLEAFVKSGTGKAFLAMCDSMDVDVEYELHALQYLLPRELYDTRPELFREDETGVRCLQYNMCFTSEEAVEAMRPRIESLLEWMHPTTHRYFFWTDDKQGKFCHCERCRDYSPSEQALVYENRLLKLLREYDPEATLAHLAYHQTLAAPVNVRASEGVFLEFAPISRDYSQPLAPDAESSLEHNLLAFPAGTQHILEYWLDESMYSHWKRDSLVLLPFDPVQSGRDIRTYRSHGATDVTTFATWLNGSYISRFGDTDTIFRGYGESF